MEKIKVRVTYNPVTRKYVATTNRGRYHLCSFFRSDYGQVWTFQNDAMGTSQYITGPEFPLDYFKALCQAFWFLNFGVQDFPEVELTVETLRLLGE